MADTRTHLVCDDTQRENVVRLLHRAGVSFVEAGWTSIWVDDVRSRQRRSDTEVIASSDPGGIPSDYSTAIAMGIPYRNRKYQQRLAAIAMSEGEPGA